MLRDKLRHCVLAIAVTAGLGAPSALNAAEPDAPEKLFTRADAIIIDVNKLLGRKFRNTTESHKLDHGALVEYYADSESGGLVWVDEKGLNDRAQAVIDEIGNAAEWGLAVSDYELPRQNEISEGSASLEDLAALEVNMSYAVLAYARHASGGRTVPLDLSENLDFKPSYADPLKVMQAMASADDARAILLDFHPKHDQFLKLKALLADAKTGAEPESEATFVPPGPTIRPGDTHPHVVLIREILGMEAPVDFDPYWYDDEMVDAVRLFQQSQGLRPDGMIGRQTRSAFNGDKEVRPSNEVGTILANMERWRWLPRELGRFYVQSNIPEFKVRIRRGKEVVFEERIVVGKLANKTPAFTDKMERVVFNPYWYPPRSIILNEIIPGAQRSSSFLARQGMQVVNARGRVVDPYYIDWYSSQPLKYQLRQPPGRGNALGVVKFLFPNKHAVYMHDTPSKNLFNKEVRTFSHGCMRVRNPKKMAEVIMGEVEGWRRPRIDSVIARGANHKVELSQQIPVHVTYFTLWVNDDNTVRYFKDIYGHDNRTLAALEGRPMPKEVNRKVTTRQLRRRRPQQEFPSFFEALFDN